jgi:hypothetical protein
VNDSDSRLGFVTQHRFVLLFVTLLVFLVVMPLVHQVREALHPAVPPALEALLFISVLAGVIISISTSRASKLLALGFGLPVALLIVVHTLTDATWTMAIRHSYAAAFLGYAIFVMLRLILTGHQVTYNTVFASLCIYLLLGVLWAHGFALIDHLDPAAFRSTATSQDPAPLLRIGEGGSTAVLYFSFCTLTTLGYGDIVPVSPMARTLASLEAITGQLYLAVLVARLVGLHIASSLEQQTGSHGPRADPEEN